MNPVIRAKLDLIIAVTAFGTIGIFVRYIALPSSIIALVRGAVGAAFLWLLLRWKKTPFQREALRSHLKLLVLSGVINALRLTGKKKEECRVVVNGAGSAGIAIAKLLLTYGFEHLTLVDRCGIISSRSEGINEAQRAMLATTNLDDVDGTLADALKGADIFIGVSAPNIVSEEMVASMADDAILFAMANPDPEILPDAAKRAGARVVGTGRSDFPNQINNVVAFPGIFKGALNARATRITEEMKLAAAEALAALVSDEELCEDFIMPEPFDPRAVDAVAHAVEAAV